MSDALNKNEIKDLDLIKNTGYMRAITEKLDASLKTSSDKTKTFNEIYEIIKNSQKSVELFLDKRIQNGEISNKSQALKSIAGNAFSLSIIYVFLKNKEFGNIRDDIFITSKISKIPNFKEISTIKIGEETQKPDCDIVIYSLHNDRTLKNVPFYL